MKSKYTILFQEQFNDTVIQIRKNNKEYILMYCKNSVKDFDRKAKRIRDIDINTIIKRCHILFDINITKDILLNKQLC